MAKRTIAASSARRSHHRAQLEIVEVLDQPQVHVRMRAAERAERRPEDAVDRRPAEPDRQPSDAAVRRGGGPCRERVRIRQQRARVVEQRAARVGQHEVAPAAVEQLDPQQRLEILQLPRDGRLRAGEP